MRQSENFADGHTRDREGRLLSCKYGLWRVTRTVWDGAITLIADSHADRPLNSPTT